MGASAVITYTVTVNNPDTGDKQVITTAASTAAGSSCPPGTTSSPCQLTVPVLTPALTITSTASTPTATPGQQVTYTLTVTDTGQTPYTGATVTDPLTGVLDDAAYNGDATTATATGTGTGTSAGTVIYTAPDLTWTGDLNPGDTATITFSVTVNNPDAGSHLLASTLTSAAPGSNCAAGSTDPRCTTTVPVSQLTITTTANVATTTPGGVVVYTTTLINTGQTPYYGITLTAGGTQGNDGTSNGDETASSGTLSVSPTGAVWTGDIPVGGTVTLTGSFTVNNPDTGAHLLIENVTSNAPGSNCPTGSTDPRCSTSIPVLTPGLSITQTASTTGAVPGQQVTFTVTIANTGQTPYTGAVVTVSFAQMFDDAAYNGGASATAGTVTYTSPVLTWTGDLNTGDSTVITYTVTVNNPDTGDKQVITTAASTATGSTCPPGTTSSPCQLTVPVLTPALTITSAATPATATPGGTVTYTITVTDTGQTPYTGATVTDPLTGVLDDAAYSGDAAATATGAGTGAVIYTNPDLTWTGNLSPGDTANITFSVTVNNPDAGNHLLASTLTSAAAGSNCPAGGTDPRCTTTVPVSDLVINFTASAGTVTPGGTLTYTATITNAGQTPYFGISVSTNTVALAANTTSDGNTTASSGTLFDRGDGSCLDRGHPRRRHRHHHLPRHRRQPRHQHHPDRHRRLHRTRKQLPARRWRPPLHPRHHRADPRPDHRDDREHRRRGARPDRHLHRHRH